MHATVQKRNAPHALFSKNKSSCSQSHGGCAASRSGLQRLRLRPMIRRSTPFLLWTTVAAVLQPTPLNAPAPRHTSNQSSQAPFEPPKADCSTLEAELIGLVSSVRGRSGPRATWLANWFVPLEASFESARRVAAVHVARGCNSISLASHAHNLRLALSPCLTQCEVVGDSHVARCYCRACNASEARPSFTLLASECSDASSPLRAYLSERLCMPLLRLMARVQRTQAETPLATTPMASSLADVELSTCVTMFGEPCCPLMASNAQVGARAEPLRL